MDNMNSDYILTYFPPPSIDLSPTKQFFSDQAMKGRQSPLDRLRQVLYDYAIRLAAGFTKFARIVYNSVANHGRERKDAMNIGAAEIILILLVAFVIVGPKDLPKVARALGRFVRYIRGMIEEVKRELGVENIESDLKSLDREVKDTMKDVDIRQDLQKTQLEMNKEFKQIDKELSFKDFKDQLKKGGT